MPSPRTHVAKRIVEARERAGASGIDLAQKLGISLAAYDDLEAYDHEAYMCVSLDQLRSLARLLKVSLRALLSQGEASLDNGDLSPSELVRRIQNYLHMHSLSIGQFEKQVGCAISPVMENPDALWQTWNVDALHDVCVPLEVSWLTVLPKCAA
jgi:transcriptional regulator with XRE-family HTH domain